jgi:PAS domain S-box-containing protein
MADVRDNDKRKKAEEELRHSKEFVETVLNSMDDAISIIDVNDFKIVGANRVFKDIYGLNEEEVIGTPCYEITHQRTDPCTPPGDICPLAETLETGKFAVFDHLHTRKGGRKEHVEVSTSPIKDEEGKIIQVVHVARNITERKQAEQQIKDIIDAAPDMIHVISPDMKIINMNSSSKKLFPHIKEGDYCYEALHKRDKVCTHCGVTKVFSDGKKHEHESAINLPIGKKIIVHSTSSPIFDGTGNIIAAVEILRDITGRKEAERELRMSEERFSSLFNLASDGILLLDHSHEEGPIIVDANISACTMHGYTREELIGKPITFLDDPNSAKLVHDRNKQLMSGKPTTFEVNHVRKDGTIFPVEVSAQLIRIGGKPYIQAIDRDITNRKKAEDAIKKYAGDLEVANQLKDLFTDIMRHDLLNQTGIIRTLAEMTLDEKGFTDLKDLQMIESSARKLEEVVNAASSYAKLESAEDIEWKEMDLNEIIKNAEDSLKHHFKEKYMKLEHLPEGKYVASTVPIVEEVFVNLLSNAVKYSGENTKVTVNIEDTGKNWRITVADQGDGVPDEFKENIFSRFTRRKKEGVKGSGIGLAIVKRIAELHRGATGVLDNPGGGSIFYFEIPKTVEVPIRKE